MSTFKLNINYIACGWCSIDLFINYKKISCCPSYIGPHPLNTLIDACLDLMLDDYYGDYYFSWSLEPEYIKFALKLDKNKMLHFEIVKYKDESKKSKLAEWYEIIPFNDFKMGVISEAAKVLKDYGLYGYRSSWDCTEFPLSSFLYISGKNNITIKNDSCISNLSEELAYLNEISSHNDNKSDEELHYEE